MYLYDTYFLCYILSYMYPVYMYFIYTFSGVPFLCVLYIYLLNVPFLDIPFLYVRYINLSICTLFICTLYIPFYMFFIFSFTKCSSLLMYPFYIYLFGMYPVKPTLF